MGEFDWQRVLLFFDGRIGRLHFWMGNAILFLAQIVVILLFRSGFVATISPMR